MSIRRNAKRKNSRRNNTRIENQILLEDEKVWGFYNDKSSSS